MKKERDALQENLQEAIRALVKLPYPLGSLIDELEDCAECMLRPDSPTSGVPAGRGLAAACPGLDLGGL